MNKISDAPQDFGIAVEDNLGLVHLCANRFRGRGIEYEELYSAGCMGLVKAARGFDSKRGVRFSTYAVPVILGEIKRVFRDGGAIHVSRGLKELALRASRENELFTKSFGREPTLSELAERLDTDIELLSEAVASSQPMLYLSDGTEDGSELDVPVPAPDNDIGDLISLRQIMSRLCNEDRQLLEYRYFSGYTQAKTAKLLNTTQVQISRREKRLLLKLREELLG